MKAVANADVTLDDARQRREKHAARLASKIERRKLQIKSTVKLLKQHKANIASQLEKQQLKVLECKSEVDRIMSEYKNGCHTLAEKDTKDLQEFYTWAKEEIIKCTDATLKGAPIEDNRDIRLAIGALLKNC